MCPATGSLWLVSHFVYVSMWVQLPVYLYVCVYVCVQCALSLEAGDVWRGELFLVSGDGDGDGGWWGWRWRRRWLVFTGTTCIYTMVKERDAGPFFAWKVLTVDSLHLFQSRFFPLAKSLVCSDSPAEFKASVPSSLLSGLLLPISETLACIKFDETSETENEEREKRKKKSRKEKRRFRVNSSVSCLFNCYYFHCLLSHCDTVRFPLSFSSSLFLCFRVVKCTFYYWIHPRSH